MAGEDVQTLDLFEHGAIGDRQQALYWRGGRRPDRPRGAADARRGRRPTRRRPRRPHRSPAPDGRTWTWDEDGLEQAIADDLGKEIALVRDPGLMQDLEDSILVTFEATLRGLADELGDAAGDLRPLPPQRARRARHGAVRRGRWEGRRLRIGEAELELLWPCSRCAIVTRDPETQEAWGGLLRHINRNHDTIFGINARRSGRARITVGDPVEVL
jgi:hypothetical protein